MKLISHILRFRFIIFTSMALIVIPFMDATAREEMPDSELISLFEEQQYEGTLNSINPEQALLIIDDQSFVLDRIIQFNDFVRSRDEVINSLKPGDLLEIEVGRIVDRSRGARLITELKILK